MKYILKYLLTLILFTGMIIAQQNNGTGSGNLVKYSVIKQSPVFKNLVIDINADGFSERLFGESIVLTSENEVWVKNTELISGNGNKYEFGNKLKKNDLNIIHQVSAEHGYIIVYGENSNEALVYLAGINGEKDSDAISIVL